MAAADYPLTGPHVHFERSSSGGFSFDLLKTIAMLDYWHIASFRCAAELGRYGA